MRTVSLTVLGVILFLASSASHVHAQANDPLEFYKGYLDVLAKAHSLEVLLPYYTKELAEGLKKMPTEMKRNYLKMNRRTLTGLTVTKQNVTASRADFEFTAKTSDGRQTTGSATLVKEGETWKIDESAWLESPPKDGSVR